MCEAKRSWMRSLHNSFPRWNTVKKESLICWITSNGENRHRAGLSERIPWHEEGSCSVPFEKLTTEWSSVKIPPESSSSGKALIEVISKHSPHGDWAEVQTRLSHQTPHEHLSETQNNSFFITIILRQCSMRLWAQRFIQSHTIHSITRV